MVKNPRGQTITEYILLFGLLTLIGIWVVKAFIGSGTGTGGSVQKMGTTAAQRIGSDGSD